MSTLNRKLWRELWAMRLQAAAISLVIAGGVAMFIMSLSTYDSLKLTLDSYYREYRFADVFVSLKRAPRSLAARVQAIPGIDRVDDRVMAYVSVDVEGYSEPVSAHIISLPAEGDGVLNRLFLRRGRLLSADSENEVLLSVEFAEAHQLWPGSTLSATINGHRRKLTVVGHVLSPEYINQLAPGSVFPDYQRYGVMWMARKPLATAFDLDGAFNQLSVTLVRGTRPDPVIESLDDLLLRYGGTGAVARDDQASHRFMVEELKQQKFNATIFPAIFFGVAAFLLNVVLGRLIALEREQIASLKAFGYSRPSIAWHYCKMVLVIVLAGALLGIAAGAWMGHAISAIYEQFYSFPFMYYTLSPRTVATAIAIASAVGMLAALWAVMHAVRMPPAQAMRPEPPARFRTSWVERLGLRQFLNQTSRMILRQLERRPVRSLLGLVGIGMACGIMMVGDFQKSAIDRMVGVQFGLSQREHLLVSFVEPVSTHAIGSLTALEGVIRAEGFRLAPVRIRHGHRSYRTALQGVDPDGQLLQVLQADLRPLQLPDQGVVLTDWLADNLQVQPGEMLRVELLERDRPELEVVLAGTSTQYLGVYGYMQKSALNQALGESAVISGALLWIDEPYRQAVVRRLKDMPAVAGVVERQSSIRAFYENIAGVVLFFNAITILLGGCIAFGVVYNSLRITLSERSRELASLRVLGFTRGEIGHILLGELGLLTFLAVPFGFLVGYGLCGYLATEFDTDLYRIPLVIAPSTYAFAATVVLASFTLSARVIWKNLGQLDMVAVLKSKE